MPFFAEKGMDTKWLAGFIKTCKKMWKAKPKHFLEVQQELIKKSKKAYDKNLKTAKADFALCIREYSYLEPVLRLINQDILREEPIH